MSKLMGESAACRIASRVNNAETGGSMRHDWIFDVLRDLKAFALANDLPGLAAKAEEAARVARVEVANLAPRPAPASDPDGDEGFAPLGKAH